MGLAIALVVFSHSILDLPLLGFGLWQIPIVRAILELILVLAGNYLYYRTTPQLPIPPGTSSAAHRRHVLQASGVTAALLILLLASDLLGL